MFAQLKLVYVIEVPIVIQKTVCTFTSVKCFDLFSVLRFIIIHNAM